ncbi:MAG: 4-hydroxy-tetrahydrodipicolinate reductase [Clostridia bacterium]|nr:4-hydroxy-tetrahydrodipicolinate reductase [Clostridia bacterium]
MRIILHGAGGHMGRIVRRLIDDHDNMTLAAAVDVSGAEGCLPSLDAFTGEADCVIDFSHHSATQTLLDYCIRRNLPLVLCTTGQTAEERAAIAEAGNRIPVFFSANMSPAIAMLAGMAAQAAKMFPDADIEIVEKHHNRKLDVPSGTALLLAKSIQEVRKDSWLNIGRHENGKRTQKEIGVHSLRMGNEVGTHEIIISTGTQTITLKHEAEDRALFAEGAIVATEFIVSQSAGVYAMQDMINAQN